MYIHMYIYIYIYTHTCVYSCSPRLPCNDMRQMWKMTKQKEKGKHVKEKENRRKRNATTAQ